MSSNLLNPALLPVLCCMLVIGANHPVADNTTKNISIIPQPQSLKRGDGTVRVVDAEYLAK